MSASFSLPTPPSLDSTIGAELVGLGVSLALYGATTGQLFWYFRKLDGLSLRKWMVYYVGRAFIGRGVMAAKQLQEVLCRFSHTRLLGTAHVMLCCYLLSRYVVIGRGDLVAIFGSTKIYAASATTSVVSSGMVRFGYFYRIWKFNRRRYLTLIIPGAVLALLVAAVSLYAHLTWTFFLASGAEMAIDFMISFAVFASFLRFYTGIKRLDLLIRTIVVFALSTGSLNVILSTCSIILFSVLPSSYAFIAVFWVFNQLEICSFFAVLNAEKELVHRSLNHARLARGAAGETIQLTTRVELGSFAGTLPPSMGGVEEGESDWGGSSRLGSAGQLCCEYGYGRRGCAMGSEASAGRGRGKGVRLSGVDFVDGRRAAAPPASRTGRVPSQSGAKLAIDAPRARLVVAGDRASATTDDGGLDAHRTSVNADVSGSSEARALAVNVDGPR
ncbi:uncharacterized protein BXZ73DRAFT_76117 [Epithele typhae]|uniref:uncharacterized protein n=1 Tax=Epithele typhae TaxID=378194 RepID=UPI00200739BC|nr:uncharacterized protein BXZ73DRAFT_76117 [Epithele typhae]KAH9938950.1 hypothetical protein BXZ73DRAFT_76117 [Epithele typhae]